MGRQFSRPWDFDQGNKIVQINDLRLDAQVRQVLETLGIGAYEGLDGPAMDTRLKGYPGAADGKFLKLVGTALQWVDPPSTFTVTTMDTRLEGYNGAADGKFLTLVSGAPEWATITPGLTGSQVDSRIAAYTGAANGKVLTRVAGAPQWADVPAGKSAYEVAVDNGFSGSEAAWLASLEGTDVDPAVVTELQDDVALALSNSASKMPYNYRIWNGTSWSARPDVPVGVSVIGDSSWDVSCVTPPPSAQTGDHWDYHPLAAVSPDFIAV